MPFISDIREKPQSSCVAIEISLDGTSVQKNERAELKIIKHIETERPQEIQN